MISRNGGHHALSGGGKIDGWAEASGLVWVALTVVFECCRWEIGIRCW